MHDSMHVSYIPIGRNIRAARQKAGLTQEALAERLKISQLHFGRLERGERPISLELLASMACELDVDLTSLLDGCMLTQPNRPSANGDAQKVGDAVAALAAGCTPRARALMVAVCGDIAASDKLDEPGE